MLEFAANFEINSVLQNLDPLRDFVFGAQANPK